MQDVLGNPVTGASAAALDQYELGLRRLQTFSGDPVAAVDAAIAAAPAFVMAHVLKAWLYALSTDKAAMDIARDIHASARALPMTAREAGHVAAIGQLVGGAWNGAGETLAAVARDHPRDALALQAGHQIDFFTGNASMLRDRIGAALPHWNAAMPGYHAMLSAHAFGLEETGDYAAAEAAGRSAVELEPHDGWGQHAVAHVMEMQCRQADGIGWMKDAFARGAEDSFMKVHNWWHLGLYHYDLGQHDEVLRLFDGPIYGDRSRLALNMVDASAILWRLHLGEVDAGKRWQDLADAWEPAAGDGLYAFNDMHAMMAFVAAGRIGAAKTLLAAQEAAVGSGGDNAAFTRDIGLPATRGILAFEDGDYRSAIDLLGPIRAIAHRFGGSHAQRDVIDLTLVEAAIRCGDAALAQDLAARRMISRPHSPLSAVFRDRASKLAH
jgi:tetratricopeptide (TPR) repeat protein